MGEPRRSRFAWRAQAGHELSRSNDGTHHRQLAAHGAEPADGGHAELLLAMEEETNCGPPRQRIRIGGEALDERRRVMEREYRDCDANLLVELERPGSAGRQQRLQKRPVGFFRGSRGPLNPAPAHRLARGIADFDLDGGEGPPEHHQHGWMNRVARRRFVDHRVDVLQRQARLGVAARGVEPRLIRARSNSDNVSALGMSSILSGSTDKISAIISSRSSSSASNSSVKSRCRRSVSTSRKSAPFGPARRFRRGGFRCLAACFFMGP